MKPAFHILAIIAIGFLAYSNTFQVPFAFDDQLVIEQNLGIKTLGRIDWVSLLKGGNNTERKIKCNQSTGLKDIKTK